MDATHRLGSVFAESVKNIRRDVPADEIVSAAVHSLFSAGPFVASADSSPKEVDYSFMKDLIDRINRGHKDRILRAAESIGEIVEEAPQPDNIAADISGSYAGEDESNVFMKVEGFTIRVPKDMVIKVLALGQLP